MPKKYIARIVEIDTLTDTAITSYEIKVNSLEEAYDYCENSADPEFFEGYYVSNIWLNREDG